MFKANILFERIPVVWILLGLLFLATGLYLGFENSIAFAYMIVGAFCFAFGIAIMIFRVLEKPKASAKTRLSPQFISAGAPQVMPSVQPQSETPVEPDAEQPAG